MPQLSDEQLIDLAEAYTIEELVDILERDTIELLDLLREKLEDNLHKLNLRPVDCNDF
jgi:hypothetical protein